MTRTTMMLTRRYTMQAAHRLTAGVSENHPCRRLHGHRYVLDISVSCEFLPEDGMILEYGHFDAVVKPVLKLVDHHDLNTLNERCSTEQATDVAKNPTVELLLRWLATRLRLLSSARAGFGLRLHRLVLEEDADSRVEWQEPDPHQRI